MRIKALLAAFVTVIALTVTQLGHAETIRSTSVDTPSSYDDVESQELTCLAKNIYYESGNSDIKGKIFVGIVTLNRLHDPRFPSTICGVVGHRTGKGNRKICQFSWKCTKNLPPPKNNDQWSDSQMVAQKLINGDYWHIHKNYLKMLYFHAKHIQPAWFSSKRRIGSAGGNVFYSDIRV